MGELNTAISGAMDTVSVTLTYAVATTGTAPDLTNGDGDVYYWNDSARAATGAAKKFGSFTFTPGWGTTSTTNKNSMVGHTYKIFIKGEGNVKVLKDDQSTPDASDASGVAKENDSAEGYALYLRNNNGALEVSRDGSTGWASTATVKYAVRTNNPNGLEYLIASENTDAFEDKGQVIKTTTDADAASETIGYSTSTYHVQEKSGTWADKANTGYIHKLADTISASVGVQDAA